MQFGKVQSYPYILNRLASLSQIDTVAFVTFSLFHSPFASSASAENESNGIGI